MSFWYLGSPYSKYLDGLDAAHREVCRAAAGLIKAGVPVYSPIAHTHPIAVHGELDPLDHNIWLPADEPMMDAAKGLIVLMLTGWQASFGLSHEIGVFLKAGKPVVYMSPDYDVTLCKNGCGNATTIQALLTALRQAAEEVAA